MLEVTELISAEQAAHLEESIGCMGGWFSHGCRWEDYNQMMITEENRYHYEALRKFIIENNIRFGGNVHQGEGIPLFSDNTVAYFSFRAWGDLLGAVWSTEEDIDYCYMDFYMS